MSTTKRVVPSTNRLLAALPKTEYQRLLPQLETFPLAFGDVLYEAGDTINYVYFPEDGIISLLSIVESRKVLEVGIVGNEGVAGVAAILGVRVSLNRGLVQSAGTALRMKATVLQREFKRDGALQKSLHRYLHALLTQISQSAVCNRFHTVDARLARWLLMTHDRVNSDEFRLTQEFLSHMLGVRREGVSKAAGALQKQGFINYSRGYITVLDRRGLEAASCKCYRIIKDESTT
ncbi:MAG TPA: Crp/Fnr family transcriptional regulator [Pyrinomonadaceae bacterium]|jgi:CRP-like cAMP-binding protein